jgi:hypothetical protein
LQQGHHQNLRSVLEHAQNIAQLAALPAIPAPGPEGATAYHVANENVDLDRGYSSVSAGAVNDRFA